MSDLRLQVKAFHADLSKVLKEVAERHGLKVSKDFIRFDQFQWKANIIFDVAEKQNELRQLQATPYELNGDPKLGQEFSYKRTTYVVDGYNRAGNIEATRKFDGKKFRFRRSHNGQFDYFDNGEIFG